jgi:CheY-like chemotaxis protein
MMPVMDGWDFIVRCRALPRCRDIPIIVMSAGYTLRTAAERLCDLGARAVIAKPFDLDALVRLVQLYAPLQSGYEVS